MKEIKAYVHRNRIAEVVSSLKESAVWAVAAGGEHNLTVYMVKGTLVPLDDRERQFSVDVGDEMINEYKLELHCADEHAQDLVEIIRVAGRTGHRNSGWIYVADIQQALAII